MLFLAFAGGALVGGAAALLFAPRSGSETRRRITGAVDDTKGFAARMPNAIHEASSAAQAAFTAALMEEHCIRRVMVLDSRKRLVGILSLDDLAMTPGRLAVDVIEKCHDPERRDYRGHWQHIG